MKAIVLILIVSLIALATVLPVSAAGQNGNGQMLRNGSGTAGTGVCPNQDGTQADCPNNHTPPRDGTGLQYGKSEQ
ncbi:MAG TPA: hypothetical protein VN429_04100 [Methanospirillum sp.]|uniref:hypothetical protein n=1 Tax=Methanospirillum sp. TaxID=45200 RepID=UPI002B52E2C7|nr:hypothetical protein [Methanospirillum sp.]HWQ63576.1 hypothetical protein [Methanospirillum sp.]